MTTWKTGIAVMFPLAWAWVCVDDALMDDSGVLVRQVRKRLIVEQTLEPGASVTRVARAHGLNANVVFHWRRKYSEGKLAETELIPVVVTGDVPPGALHSSASAGSIRIDLPDGAVISVEDNADLALIWTIVESLRA
jgi:transposase